MKTARITKSKLLKKTNFSSPQLIVFVLVFALVGILIYESLATSPLVATLEAEQMVLPSGGSVITDSLASGGKAIKLTTNGASTGSVNFPSSVTSLTIIAKGAQCSGSPAMNVAIDGTNLLTGMAVASTSWAGYSANTNLNAGTHSLSISFTNAYSSTGHGKKGSGSCTRALYLDVTNFYGPIAVTPPPAVALSASPTSVTAGSASTLTWNSTNATSCTTSGAWSGSQPTSGSTSTGALNQSSTYTLSCSGAGGSASGSAVISVTAVLPPPVSLGGSLPAQLPESSGMQLTGSPTNSLSTLFSGLAAGSRLCLHSGIYGQGLTTAVTLSVSGTATNPITIESCAGETAQIAQQIQVTGSYIRLRNLKIIRNNYPTDARYSQSGSNPGGNVGIWLKDGQHVTLEKSEITGATMSGIFGGGAYNQILSNYVHDNGTTPDDHGIYYTSGNSLIANNIFYHNYDFGIQLGYTGAVNNIVANNTTVYNGFGNPSYPGSGTVTFSGTANNIFVNNISANNAQFGYKTYDTANSLSHNYAFSNPAGATSGSFSPITALSSFDPLFISSTDFHLQASSTAKTAGDPAYTPPLDYDGQARQSAGIGAFR